MMADKLFTKRLRDLTDEAIRESLAEISVEFEKRFGPAAWNTRATQPLSLTVDEGDGFEVEVGDDSYAILWPDGWWLDAHRNGKITIGKSPYDAATHPQQATLPALLDRLQSLSLPVAGEQIAENANCSGDIDRSGLAQEVDDISYAGVGP